MKNPLLRIVRDHRDRAPARYLANVCERYLRAYWNENNWTMEENGESRVLSIFASETKAPVIFDVGANTGEWSRLAARLMPDAMIYAFEIIPDVFEQLKKDCENIPNIVPVASGLSNFNGSLAVTYNKTHPSTSSVVANSDSDFFPSSVIEQRTCKVERGDDFAIAHNLTHIDFIKIDTEGHEVDVLKGLSAILSAHPPRMIQFEYGRTFFNAGRTLKEAYALLEPSGYSIGRIFPRHVEFKPFAPSDEHFRMGNYLAVQRDAINASLK